MKFFNLLLLAISLFFVSFAQQNSPLFLEDSIVFYLKKSKTVNDDNQKIFFSEKAFQLTDKLLKSVNPFEYDFKLLKQQAIVLKSSDKNLISITWGVQLFDKSKFWGYLIFKNKKGNVLIFPLLDKKENIKYPEKQQLTNENWYGAVYYAVVETKYKSQKYYTFLGYDANDLLTNRKVVETVYFKNDKPVFGGVFELEDQRVRRMIFEYAEQAVMVLRWENSLKMIVFDHLAPSKPEYVGLYQFYGPDLTYDALKFSKGKWVLIPDVDVRNPKPKK